GALRLDDGGAGELLRRVPRRAGLARRRAPRVHRRRRHRVPRRVGGPLGRAARPPVRDALRSAAERAAVTRPGVPPGRAHAALKLAVVGTGLIGASVGLAAHRRGWTVAGWDPDAGALAVAVERRALEPAAALEGGLGRAH